MLEGSRRSNTGVTRTEGPTLGSTHGASNNDEANFSQALNRIGTEGDTHFMVQEYSEGQSLRERLDKGALPLGKRPRH